MSPQGRPLSEWWKRVLAALLDGVIVGIPATIIILVVIFGAFASADCETVGDTLDCENVAGPIISIVISYLVVFALQIAYQVVMNGGERGQTVGKMVMKIQVRDEATGGPIGYGKAALRVLVTFALSLACGVGQWLDVLWPLWDQKRQTIHDKAASTLVVDTQ